MSSSPGPLPPHAIVFGPNANCTLDICPVQYSVYGYRPNLAANASFIALFAIAAQLHFYLGLRWRTWFFAGCVVVSCLSAILGYVGRIMMYYDPFSFSAFMLQIICVTTTPVYYCAAIYVTLSATVSSLSPELSHFKPKLFYWIFIPCDLVSLVFQAAGGALSTQSSGTSQRGIDLAIAGLSFQVFTICCFCGLMMDYMLRYYRSGKHADQTQGPNVRRRRKVFFSFLALAVVLTAARCVYRLAELHEGYRGDMVRHEGLFIGLEGVLVLASVYCLMLGHPGLGFPSEKGKRDRPGMAHSPKNPSF